MGHHLRDYNVLAHIAKRALKEGLDVHFTVVARLDRTKMLAGLTNVDLLSGISDAQLLQLYQTSDVLVTPLKDATANIAILEGMACGLPVFATDVPGVHDYTTSGCRVLAPISQPDLLYDALVLAWDGELDLEAMGKASRAGALELDWTNVRTRLDAVYDTLS